MHHITSHHITATNHTGITCVAQWWTAFFVIMYWCKWINCFLTDWKRNCREIYQVFKQQLTITSVQLLCKMAKPTASEHIKLIWMKIKYLDHLYALKKLNMTSFKQLKKWENSLKKKPKIFKQTQTYINSRCIFTGSITRCSLQCLCFLIYFLIWTLCKSKSNLKSLNFSHIKNPHFKQDYK